jgi:tRNA(adenine34) deaminase
MDPRSDRDWMKLALAQARKSLPEDVPVGALVVKETILLGRGYNQRERRMDPTLHAEILALRAAARNLGNWYLDGCTLYVTLEPCPMCAGALFQARLARVVWGADDPKGGAFGGVIDLNAYPFPHHLRVESGVLAQECATLLRDFFRARRGG